MVAQTVRASSQAVEQSRSHRQPDLLPLYRMEWFKVVRRRMTHVVFFLMAGALGFTPFAGYLTYVRGDRPSAELGYFLMPDALSRMNTAIVNFGLILAIVLAAGLAGSEFGWGTVRTMVGSGAARWKLLAAKYLAVVTAVVALVIFGLGVGIATSMTLGMIEGYNPVDWVSGEALTDLLLQTIRASFILIFLATLAFTVSQITRSTAAGIATGIGLMIIDPILMMLSETIGGYAESASRWLVSSNMTAIDALNSSDPAAATSDLNVFGPWAAAGILALYTAILLTAAFASFTRRDISVD